ncbi:diacylglycerol/lipid kinase family protein [Hymenobacter koreensis]|uniref:Diacylglycerol kinase family lipid kinase n=1 Tax=Hymenobacter koreensis TaxID=1084523 RepID=A0ABP8J804_9BACT
MSDAPLPLHRVLFVMNPISGDIDKETVLEQLQQVCAERGNEVHLFETTGTNDLTNLRQQLQENSYDVVFGAGGDGTVRLVAEAVLAEGLPMGIIPLGSGNGLSKDLDIPQQADEALNVLWEHRVREIDTLSVSGHLTVHLADLGFNAVVVERFSTGDTRGPGAYVRVALQEYMGYEPARYRIETDTEHWEGEAFMLTIANARTFGSNVVINPDSQLDDGWFELCIIEPFPGAAAPGILYDLYTEGFENSDYTRRLRCRKAQIWVLNEEKVQVQVDGEPMELSTPLEVTISPRSLRVLVPA